MNTYTYTIFDGNPSSNGPCEWPSHTDIEIEAETHEEALDEALAEADIQGSTCGQYSTGDKLWILVWDSEGNQIDGSIVLDIND